MQFYLQGNYYTNLSWKMVNVFREKQLNFFSYLNDEKDQVSKFINVNILEIGISIIAITENYKTIENI